MLEARITIHVSKSSFNINSPCGSFFQEMRQLPVYQKVIDPSSHVNTIELEAVHSSKYNPSNTFGKLHAIKPKSAEARGLGV